MRKEQINSVNPTIRLLRTIGSPFVPVAEMPGDDIETPEIYDLAVKNKIPLLYMETLKQRGKLNKLKTEYDKEYRRYTEFIEEFTKTAKILNATDVDYAVFKTVRPYPVVPGDVDIVILGGDSEYKKAVELFLKANYKEAVPDGPCPQAGDLMNPIKKIPTDLQKEVEVSYVVYMDKNKFEGEIIKDKLPSGEEIYTLTSELDLAIVIAHSIIQEQMYLLGEFYTFIYLLSKMNENEISKFVSILKDNKVVTAARHHLTVTTTLYEAAYGAVPQKLDNILNEIGTEESEARRLIKSDFKMPHRFSLLTLAKVSLEKMKEKRFRRSVASQVLHMLDPRLTKFVISQVIFRRKREYSIKDYVKTGITLKDKCREEWDEK